MYTSLMATVDNHEQLHFLLIPFMAQGHTIPMIDIAKLLAQRGIKVTLLLTPMNHTRLHPVLARANELGMNNIHVIEIHFPTEEAGLPPGCENFDTLPTTSLAVTFFMSTKLIRPQVEMLVRQMHPKPSCLLADMCFTFASELALLLGIPRILFHGMCCFARLCVHQIAASKILDDLVDETKVFDVPDMPDKCSFRVSQVEGMIPRDNKDWREFQDKQAEAEKLCYGVIFNTFEDLEARFIDKYAEVKAKKVWTVGPVSMCNKEYTDKVIRGNYTSTKKVQECLKWLELQEHGSVVYACFGSICNLTSAQMLELGLGLEASSVPFIWVIRTGGASNYMKDLKHMMEQNGLEERLMKSSKGFVIWGWAPQVVILSHPSVGGFLTHCGWNSSLEGIASGLPMLTWPLFGDQFYNEKLVVDVLGIGVRIGVQRMMQFGKEDEIGVLVVPLMAAMTFVTSTCAFQLIRNMLLNPDVRISKEHRRMAVLENNEEGEKYAQHSLRKFLRNRPPEVMPTLNQIFAGPSNRK